MTALVPVLALDLSLTTGWALWDSCGRVTSGVQSFETKRGESVGMRFLRARAWLREVMAFAGGKGVIAYEQAHHRGGHATAVAVGLVTVVLEEAAAQGWETVAVHTNTLKKHATGKGNAKKPDMIAAARARWERPEVSDDNEADALLVLAWALDEIGQGKVRG